MNQGLSWASATIPRFGFFEEVEGVLIFVGRQGSHLSSSSLAEDVTLLEEALMKEDPPAHSLPTCMVNKGDEIPVAPTT